MHLVKNGTDPLEHFFSIVRAKNNSCNLDALDFVNYASAVAQCNDITLHQFGELVTSVLLK